MKAAKIVHQFTALWASITTALVVLTKQNENMHISGD